MGDPVQPRSLALVMMIIQKKIKIKQKNFFADFCGDRRGDVKFSDQKRGNSGKENPLGLK